MTLVSFLSDLREQGIELWSENGQLHFRAPAGAMTVAVRHQITARKDDLLTFLNMAEHAPTPERPPVQRHADRQKPPPLSFSQQRLWFLDRFEPGNAAYNFPIAVRLSGKIELSLVERIVTTLVQRHETFRTTFPMVEQQPVQMIAPPPTDPVKVSLLDLSHIPESEREESARQRLYQKAGEPFDLAQGPLLKVTLFRLTPLDHILLINTHHIISDGWSMGVLVQEILSLYAAFSQGLDSPLPPLPVQYADFTYWQQAWLQGETLHTQLAYWKQQLSGELPLLELPTDHTPGALQTFNGARIYWQLSPRTSGQLMQFCRQEGVTAFMTLLAAFKVLLYGYTGQTDILVGSPIANRTRPELEGLIGFFVNTLVMRTDLSGDPTFRELLLRVRQVASTAYAHQDLPFEKLVEELQPARDLSRSPLVQVLFALQNAPVPDIDLPGLTASPMELDSGATPFALSLHIREIPDEITGFLEYNSDLFERTTIERLRDHYQTLLAGALANPDLPLSQLPLLTAAEEQQLLLTWNETAAPYPHQTTVFQMIAAQAAHRPQQTAVTFNNGRQPAAGLTYDQLNQRANQLAHYLRRLGVGPGVLVGICIERSLEMLVGLLGILKAGGAYLPLDPTYPPERLDFMLADSQAPLLLTQQHLLDSLPAGHASPICLDTYWPTIAQEAVSEPTLSGSSSDLAYVIYTSGSTGRPKGVAISHQALVNFLVSMQQQPGLTAADKLLAVTTLSFDIAMLELFLPLISGGQLVIAGSEVVADGHLLQDVLSEAAITIMQATPATWQMLLSAGWQGCPQLKILCGGEGLPRALADQLLPRAASLWNMYGPTETTIWSTCCRVESGEEGWVSIGRPIANTHCFVLDKQQRPVPVGVAGELYIGGDGLAQGYLNRPELTAEKFVPHPFDPDPSARLYRTGDQVCYRPDGSLRFLNRLDHQVKVRGYRIELGEIEKSLEQHPQVRQAVVTAREDTAGDKRLVAYILAEEGDKPGVTELRRFLQSRLPDYMVVSTVVTLDAFPLTLNGKVNRRALPKPDTLRPQLETAYLAPTSALEQSIASIWQQLLQVERVGIHDNFFDLGGHSLLMVQAHMQVQEQVRQEFSLIDLFKYPTVHTLARHLSRIDDNPTPPAQLSANRREQMKAGKLRLKQRNQQRRKVL